MWITKQKRSPYYQVRYYHPDGSGRIVQESTREKTKRAATARGKEIAEEAKRLYAAYERGGRICAQRVIDEYWEHDLSKLKWAKNGADALLARIAEFLGERPYCEVSISDVSQYVDIRSSQGATPATINRELAIWRRMHNLAGKKREYPVKLIDWSVVAQVEPVGRTRSLTPEEVRHLFSLLPMHAAQIVMFAVLTGARKGQILSLTRDRVDLASGTVTVFKKHRRDHVPHVLTLNKDAHRLVALRMEAPKQRDNLLFDTTNFRRHWYAAVRASGIEDLRFHDLRHTFATWLIKRGSLALVKDCLGHSGVGVTMRYAHIEKADVKRTVDELPDLLIHDAE